MLDKEDFNKYNRRFKLDKINDEIIPFYTFDVETRKFLPCHGYCNESYKYGEMVCDILNGMDYLLKNLQNSEYNDYISTCEEEIVKLGKDIDGWREHTHFLMDQNNLLWNEIKLLMNEGYKPSKTFIEFIKVSDWLKYNKYIMRCDDE